MQIARYSNIGNVARGNFSSRLQISFSNVGFQGVKSFHTSITLLSKLVFCHIPCVSEDIDHANNVLRLKVVWISFVRSLRHLGRKSNKSCVFCRTWHQLFLVRSR